MILDDDQALALVSLLHRLYAEQVDWAYDDNGAPIDPNVATLHTVMGGDDA